MRALVLSVLVFAPLGCGAAIAAGAGAGAAIAYSERGASSTVEAPVEEVITAARGAFAQLGIAEAGEDADTDGNERELKGSRGDLEITIDVERSPDGLTAVDVFAQESTIDYDREYAREVLANILARL